MPDVLASGLAVLACCIGIALLLWVATLICLMTAFFVQVLRKSMPVFVQFGEPRGEPDETTEA